MADLKHSSRCYVRFMFKFICVVMAILLGALLFPSQSIAYARENAEANVDLDLQSDIEDIASDQESYSSSSNSYGSDFSSDDQDSSGEDTDESYTVDLKNASLINGDAANRSSSGKDFTLSSVYSNASGASSLGSSNNDDQSISVSNYDEFASAVKNYDHANISLASDIKIDNYTKLYHNLSFNGHLEGNGHKIYTDSGFSCPDGFKGLFERLNDGAYINNVIFNVNISAPGLVGGISQWAAGTVKISNCTISGSIISTAGEDEFEWEEDKINMYAYSGAAGLIAVVKAGCKLTLENIIVNSSEIRAEGTDDSERYAGGLTAYNNNGEVNISNCSVSNQTEIHATGGKSLSVRITFEVLKVVVGIIVGSLIAKAVNNTSIGKKWADYVKACKYKAAVKKCVDKLNKVIKDEKVFNRWVQDAALDETALSDASFNDLLNLDDNTANLLGEELLELNLKIANKLKGLKQYDAIQNALNKICKDLDVHLQSPEFRSLIGDKFIKFIDSKTSLCTFFQTSSDTKCSWLTKILLDIYGDAFFKTNVFAAVDISYHQDISSYDKYAPTKQNTLFADSSTSTNGTYGMAEGRQIIKMFKAYIDNPQVAINPDDFMLNSFLNEGQFKQLFTSKEFAAWYDKYKIDWNIAGDPNVGGSYTIQNAKAFSELYKLYADKAAIANCLPKVSTMNVGTAIKLKQIDILAQRAIWDEVANASNQNYAYWQEYRALLAEYKAGNTNALDWRVNFKNLEIQAQINKAIYETMKIECRIYGIDDATLKVYWDSQLTNQQYTFDNNYCGIELMRTAKILGDAGTDLIAVSDADLVMNQYRYLDFLTDGDGCKALLDIDGNYNIGDTFWVGETNKAIDSFAVATTGSLITNMRSELTQTAQQLGSAEGGTGEMHLNAYAGGLIGYSISTHVSINNSANDADVYGGHNAGGLIAYFGEARLDITNTSNSGTVSTADNWFYTASGGFLGQVEDLRSDVEITNCINSGYVLSHRIAGGYIGNLDSSSHDIEFTNCGSIGGIAAPSNASGYVAYVDESNTITFNNCYSQCVYDVATTKIVYVPLSFIFLPDINYTPYEDSLEADTSAGAFLGSNNAHHNFNNCYYLEGVNPICGSKVGIDVSSCCPMQESQFASGEVTWKLNYADQNTESPDYREDFAFGQVINDLSSGNKQFTPIPSQDMIVYKDSYNGTPYYSNYNPRNVELKTLTFDTKNTTIDPSLGNVNFVKVKKGSTYKFKAIAENGCDLEDVYLHKTYSSGEVKDEKLEPLETKSNYAEYEITDITTDCYIDVKAKDFTAKTPLGNGTEFDPYLISDRAELYWFNTVYLQAQNPNVHVKITADIDYGSLTWNTMYSSVPGWGFAGVFDGDGHTIKFNSTSSTSDVNAFFGGVEGGTIKNLTIEGNFSTAVFTYSARNAVFDNCTSKGNVSSSNSFCGGIAAVGTDDVQMINCTNEANISQTSGENETACGGMVGKLTDETYFGGKESSTELTARFRGCVNKGFIQAKNPSSDNYAGGIVGIIAAWDTTWATSYYNNNFKVVNVSFERCENYGNIADAIEHSYNNLSGGGILGAYYCCKAKNRSTININACINWGNIGYDNSGAKSSSQASGGMVGWCNCYGIRLYLWNSINAGSIWAYGDDAGGFLGTVGGCNGNWSSGIICNCASLGEVDSDDTDGSIIGSGYFYASNQGRDNGFSGGLLTSAWCNNVYVAKSTDCGQIDGTIGVDVIDWDCYGYNYFNEHYLSHKGKGDIEDVDIYDGKLVYEMNEFYKNNLLNPSWHPCQDSHDIPNYIDQYGEDAHAYVFGKDSPKNILGQNIDIFNTDETNYTRQGTPHLLAKDTQQVYYNDEEVTGYHTVRDYTNFDLVKYQDDIVRGEDVMYKISVDEIEGSGRVNYQSYVKRGENAQIEFQPDPGWVITYLIVDGCEVSPPASNVYYLNNIDSDHCIDYVEFSNIIEPVRDTDGTYLVKNVYELKWLSNYISTLDEETSKSVKIKLINDIQITNVAEYEPLGSATKPFMGKFDGGEMTITIQNNKSVFGYVKDADISKLKLSVTCTSETPSDWGSLALISSGANITEVSVSGALYSGGSSNAVGGLIGKTINGVTELTNCVNSMKITTDASLVGGLIGKVESGHVSIIDCSNKDDIISNCSTTGNYVAAGGAIGGINGKLDLASYGSECVFVKNFTNSSKVSSLNITGGIIGVSYLKNSAKDSTIKLEKCINEGEIFANTIAGGIVGKSSETDNVTLLKIYLCENRGNINVSSKSGICGGILGNVWDKEAKIEINGGFSNAENFVTNTETGNTSVAGGIVGYVQDTNSFTIKNSSAFNHYIDCSNKCGAIAGANDAGTKFVLDTTSCWGYSSSTDKYVGSTSETYDAEQLYGSFVSGKVTYLINQALSNNEAGPDNVVGQNIDLADSKLEFGPHIGGNKLYDINGVRYSNYESGSQGEGLYNVTVVPSQDSEDYSAAKIYSIKAGETVTVNLRPGDSRQVITNLTVKSDEATTYPDVRSDDVLKFSLPVTCQNSNITVTYRSSIDFEPQYASNEYHIYTPNELMWVASAVNSGEISSDATIVIMNDIDMSKQTWNPIGNSSNNQFTGHFNGNNKKIIGLNGSNSFIGYANGAVIEDLELSVNLIGDQVAACLLEGCKVQLSNIKTHGSLSFEMEGSIAGGVVGRIINSDDETRSVIDSCESDVRMPVTYDGDSVLKGGILACTQDSGKVFLDIKNCINRSNLSSTSIPEEIDDANACGGIVGSFTATKDSTITNCENYATVNGYMCGGIVGRVRTNKSKNEDQRGYITKCTNYGTVTSSRNVNYDSEYWCQNVCVSGGIVGAYDYVKSGNNLRLIIEQCINNGYIESNWAAGGVIGYVFDYDFYGSTYLRLIISSCGNNGEVYCSSTYNESATYKYFGAGGIVGVAANILYIAIANSYNSSKVHANIVSSLDERRWGAVFGRTSTSYSTRGIFVTKFAYDNSLTDSDAGARYNEGAGEYARYETIDLFTASKDQFVSGEVAYKLSAKGTNRLYTGYDGTIDISNNLLGQTIDNVNLGERQSYPVAVIDSNNASTNMSNKVYEILVGGAKVYSNFQSNSEATYYHFAVNVNGGQYGNVSVLNRDGSIGADCSNGTYLSPGADFACIAQPNDGYMLSSITVDGKKRDLADFNDDTNPYNVIKFENIKADHYVQIEFSDVKAPLSGDGSVTNPFIITSYQELLWFSNYVNSLDADNKNTNAKLSKAPGSLSDTIICSGAKWVQLGTAKRPYNGIFDGNGMTLLGLTDTSNKDCLAFAGYTKNAQIKNLNFRNLSFTSSSKVAGVVYYSENTTLENVNVLSGSLRSSGKIIGGIVGYALNGTNLIKCNNQGLTFSTAICEQGAIGGIVAYVTSKANVVIDNCINYSSIATNTEGDGYTKDEDTAGGIIGYSHGRGGNITIKNCVNYGSVTGDWAGGLISTIDDDGLAVQQGGVTLTINNSVNKGHVCGRRCGGLLGNVTDVDDHSHVYINNSINEGYVGIQGSIIEDAGGLIGYCNDSDCNVSINSSINKGLVMNEESTAFYIQEWSSSASGVAGMTLPWGIMGIMFAISGTIPGLGEIVSAAVFALIAAGTLIYNIIEGRMAVQQYAGGICAEFDSPYANVTLNNVVNLGYVQATNWEDGICADFDSNSTINNVYSLNGGNDGNYKSCNYVNANAFQTGEVAYILQQQDPAYGQIIDNLSLGPAQFNPNFIMNSDGSVSDQDHNAKIYKHTKTEGEEEITYYSNFAEEIEPVGELKVECLPEEAIEQTESQEISDYATVVVTSNNKVGEIDPEDTPELTDMINKYLINNGGNSQILIKPKDNKYTIGDIEFENSAIDDYRVKYMYNDDGSFVKLYNPVYKTEKDVEVLTKYDLSITYYVDGSVRIIAGRIANPVENNVIKFDVLDKLPQIHSIADKETKTMFWPHNYEDALPNEAGRYYLTSDVTLTSDWLVPEGDTKLCLNGHQLMLDEEASIVANNGCNLEICDCDETAPLHKYSINSDGIYEFNELGDKYIESGLIRPVDTSVYSDKPIFKIDGSKFYIHNVAVCQSNRASAIDYSSGMNNDIVDNAALLLDASIYGAPGTKDRIDSKASVNIETNISQGELEIGKYSKFVHEDKVDSVFGKYADIYYAGNTGYTVFNEDYEFNEAIRVNASSDIDLTKSLDAKADVKKVFESVDDDYVIALTGKAGEGDIDDHKSANQLSFVNKNNTVLIHFEITGPGKFYPYTEVSDDTNGVGATTNTYSAYYKKGSDIKIEYAADDYACLVKLEYAVLDTNANSEEWMNLPDEGNYVIQNVTSEAKVSAEFKPNVELATDVFEKGEVNPWDTASSLPTVASDTKVPIAYKLNTDVVLNDTWEVPQGSIALDLAGHSISLADRDYSNKNVIHVNNEKTVLTIIDSSLDQQNERTKHYFKLIENYDELFNTYNEYVEGTADDYDVCVEGGIIYGCNIAPSNYQYYNYLFKSGAVNVENGCFNLSSGTIAGNNSKFLYSAGSIDGGAAVSVGENGAFNMYEKARICANTISGDNTYDSHNFAGAVASLGAFYNEGQIDNNVANQYAASAVSVSGGTFENRGIIQNNTSSFNTAYDTLDTFGTVYNSGIFINEGSIINNHSSVECAAVINEGSFQLGSYDYNNGTEIINKSSVIADNTCEYVPDPISGWVEEKVLDINSSKAIEFIGKLTENQPSVVEEISTNNWSNAKCQAADIFKLNDEDSRLAVNDKGELEITSKDNSTFVEFETVGDGTINYISDYYCSGIDLNIEALANDRSILSGATIDGNSVVLDKNDLTYVIVKIPKANVTNEEEGEEVEEKPSSVKVYFEDMDLCQARGDTKPWFATTNLPEVAGSYILQNDIELSQAWHACAGDTTIDLNGHNITTKEEDTNIIWINNTMANVVIKDSSYGTPQIPGAQKNYLRPVAGSENIYEISRESGPYECPTGIIGGAKFTSTNYSGAIIVLDGRLDIQGGTIAANVIDNRDDKTNGKGAAGVTVFDKGILTIGQDATIAANTAFGVSGSSYPTVAGLADYGRVVNNGWISYNHANENAVAGVYIADGAYWVNNGWIQDNEAEGGHSFSAMLACNAASVDNKGSILGNTASDGSDVVGLYDTVLMNSGIIHDNYVDSSDNSVVYVNGSQSKIEYDGVGGIYNNGVSNGNNGIAQNEDIKFENVDDKPIVLATTYDVASAKKSYITVDNQFIQENYQLTDGYEDTFSSPLAANNYFETNNEGWIINCGLDNNEKLELYYSDASKDNTYIKVSATDGGTVNYLGEVALVKDSGIKFNLNAKADANNEIESISVNGSNQDLGQNKQEFNIEINDSEDTAVLINFKDTNKKNAPDTSAYELWTSKNSLPTTTGSYKLTSDVHLSSTCVPVKDANIQLDLNGYIVYAPANDRAIMLNNKNAEMDIFDTSEESVVHRYTKAEDGNYVLTSSTGPKTIELQGGAIYGGVADEGAGIYIGKDNFLSLNYVNVVGNIAKYSGGGILNYGRLLINEDSNVSGNVALVGAGICNDVQPVDNDLDIIGEFVNAGNVTDNTAIVTEIDPVTHAYVNDLAKAAGVYNNAKMSIKDNSNISNNKVIDRGTKKEALQDIVIASITAKDKVLISVVGKLLCKEPCYVLCESDANLGLTQLTEGWKTYGEEIDEGIYFAAGNGAYQLVKGQNGELYITGTEDSKGNGR